MADLPGSDWWLLLKDAASLAFYTGVATLFTKHPAVGRNILEVCKVNTWLQVSKKPDPAHRQ
ncbi:uncharacterized protein ARMOST_07596 [Armillaria ostoyae]|uniref:Uncharacterized protein n=1 Tax=Armillaria ostoyae TaxID=47428 RepID=A0A284R697_ARMOS|nr:uncharacterized protein ARMOST_07596 [Armillaria ostoyae]